MREVAHAGPAVFLLDRDAVQPERAHLGPQLDREAVGPVDLGGERRDLVLGEIAHAVAQHVDLGAEIVVEHRQPGVLHPSIMVTPSGLTRVAGGALARRWSAPPDAAEKVGPYVGPDRLRGDLRGPPAG